MLDDAMKTDWCINRRLKRRTYMDTQTSKRVGSLLNIRVVATTRLGDEAEQLQLGFRRKHLGARTSGRHTCTVSR